VTRPESEPITDVQLRLLRAITDHAALAINNAQLFERMRDLSAHDELTGLPNHRHLRSHLEREIDRARRFEKPFSVLNIQLDNLAALSNDDLSRRDEVLRITSSTLLRTVRKIDTVARTANERFVILLPRTEARDGLHVGEKVRKALSAQTISADSDAHVSVSVGVAQLETADDEHGDSLIARAEQGLEICRAGGGNRVASVDASAASKAMPSQPPS